MNTIDGQQSITTFETGLSQAQAHVPRRPTSLRTDVAARTLSFITQKQVRMQCCFGDYNGRVVIDGEDKDVYLLAAYVSQQIRGDLLTQAWVLQLP